jgi:hypothetical protein
MSSNRLIYDSCAYDTTMKESTGQLEYFLYKGKYENSTQCPIGDYPSILDFNDRANVENELYGLSRLNTKCPSLKFDPNKEFKYPDLTPNKLCESIYYITPNNLEKPKTNMLNEENIRVAIS